MEKTETLLSSLETDERKAIRFGVSHLALLVTCFLALAACVYLFDSRRADRADSRAALAEQKAKGQDSQNLAVQQETTKEIAALAEQNRGLQTQIGTLATAIASRDQALAQNTRAVAGLPPTALATQWGAAAGEVAPALTPTGEFIATLPLAQKSLIALESVPVLVKDKQDLRDEVQKERTVAANGAVELSKEQAAHLSDTSTCRTDKQALQAQITKAKRDAARSKFRWAAGGFLTGALTVLAHFI